jgi:hypothetical protein
MPLFLVDLAAGSPNVDGIERMHAAFEHAVSRRAAAGATIGWVGGVLVPSADRCLCLVAAGDRDDVLAARDLAGLHLADVRRAYLLPHRQGGVTCAEPDEPRAHREEST